MQLFPSQDSVYAPWKTYTESCGKKSCTKLAISNLYNNQQLLDEVEQNIMIYQWRADQLFAEAEGWGK